MEKNLNVEVIVKSKEFVKPSIPTPNHLKTFTLSYVDQILPLVPPFLSTGLVFYATSPGTQPIDIGRLKTSLSKTLTRFYPLAGRIKQSIIVCNDEGIPFIETQVNCSLTAFLNSPNKLEFMPKLLPPREALGLGTEPVTELVHIALQINIFTCGGVAMGWYDIHKVMDGSSSATFFKHWAALANQRYDEISKPDFDATVAAFPPSIKASQLQWDNGEKNDDVQAQHSRTVVKSFIFRNDAISHLKAKGACELVPNPTRYTAMAGFIWEHVMASSKRYQYRTYNDINEDDHEKLDETILQVTLDLRPRVNPPLPRGSMGNLVNTAVARARRQTTMQDLVGEIHDAVAKTKGEIMGYQGERAVHNIRKNWNTLIETVSKFKDRAYKLVSWSNLGFSDLDFGFGKPRWMVPTDGIMSPFHKNLIILTDYKDLYGEDAIEAWFFLGEEEMKSLESNKDFLQFASPAL